MFHYEMSGSSYGYFFEIKNVKTIKTPYQKITIGKSPVFGKVLLIDDVIQISEKDEKWYHEPLIHVPLGFHPNPKKVLILGGGDGCAAREVLKSNIEKLVLVDIDKEMIKLGKTFLRSINNSAFFDKRIEIRVEDAMKYIRETNEKFDVIVVDLVDPVGDAKNFYSEETFSLYKSILNKNGIIVSHIQGISLPHKSAQKMYVVLKRFFKFSKFYMSYVQSFDDTWAFGVFSDTLNFESKSSKSRLKRYLRKMENKLEILNEKYADAIDFIPKEIEKEIKILEKKKRIKIDASVDKVGNVSKNPFS